MRLSPHTRLRRLCLALPEAHEVEAWGEPTYRVRNKIFAMQASADTHHGGGRPAVWLKCLAVNQQLLLREDPARYFFPPYVGASGWIGIHLDAAPDWKSVAELVRDAWRLAAPKRLVARFDPEQ
ncbi:MAG: MmcQ/YjbR family DNA-binding protein [Gemmatimonadaceae bacterium]|nr:MmcQ/YjbR family DNA-binding protein [Gemmatimonadaceae bacterium]NUQ92668.1 MmcQ/YjbR family DNA-binding protein [Gemmatimonadaceae bacterium]NUR18146.1 MmcQ/YjbR family DNA-binding protein [Gemmatimonadaceae bacterium]NUS98728.1 MmcQ/YjbR family DNA-binding protein [Gemmatimonadaceae bacterium]